MKKCASTGYKIATFAQYFIDAHTEYGLSQTPGLSHVAVYGDKYNKEDDLQSQKPLYSAV